MVDLYITSDFQENLFYAVPYGAMETYKLSIKSQVAQCEVSALFWSVCAVPAVKLIDEPILLNMLAFALLFLSKKT